MSVPVCEFRGLNMYGTCVKAEGQPQMLVEVGPRVVCLCFSLTS